MSFRVDERWWPRGDSNPRPPRCERGALPAELLAHEQQIDFSKGSVLANTPIVRKHVGAHHLSRLGRDAAPPITENGTLRVALTAARRARPRLRNRFHGLLYLWVGFEQYLKPFLLSEAGHKHFLLDLPLDPLEALGHLGLRIPDVVLFQLLANGLHTFVICLKF